MGNHEYCSNCGESDFHYGQPCDPAKVAAKQAKEKAQEVEHNAQVEEAKRRLSAAGIPFYTEVSRGVYFPITRIVVDTYRIK